MRTPWLASILRLVFLGLLSTGCIGTDLVGETLEDLGDPRIEITPEELALELGTTASYEAVYYRPDGTVDEAASFTWLSSDANIATVSDAGLVTPVSVGQASVRASARGVESDPVLLTVVEDPNQLARVALQPSTISLTPGVTAQLSVRLFSLAGDELPARAITYSMADPAIATVSANGLARGVAPGITGVTASVDGITSTETEIPGTFRARSGTTYTVTGGVTLQEDSDGSVALKIGSDFVTTNGPSLHVYLSTSDGVTSTSVDLGALQATSGEQEYSVGQGVDLTTYRWVIIHCVPFNLTFGSAQLR